jgi:hypothetical protein
MIFLDHRGLFGAGEVAEDVAPTALLLNFRQGCRVRGAEGGPGMAFVVFRKGVRKG